MNVPRRRFVRVPAVWVGCYNTTTTTNNNNYQQQQQLKRKKQEGKCRENGGWGGGDRKGTGRNRHVSLRRSTTELKEKKIIKKIPTRSQRDRGHHRTKESSFQWVSISGRSCLLSRPLCKQSAPIDSRIETRFGTVCLRLIDFLFELFFVSFARFAEATAGPSGESALHEQSGFIVPVYGRLIGFRTVGSISFFLLLRFCFPLYVSPRVGNERETTIKPKKCLRTKTNGALSLSFVLQVRSRRKISRTVEPNAKSEPSLQVPVNHGVIPSQADDDTGSTATLLSRHSARHNILLREFRVLFNCPLVFLDRNLDVSSGYAMHIPRHTQLLRRATGHTHTRT